MGNRGSEYISLCGFGVTQATGKKVSDLITCYESIDSSDTFFGLMTKST